MERGKDWEENRIMKIEKYRNELREMNSTELDSEKLRAELESVRSRLDTHMHNKERFICKCYADLG